MRRHLPIVALALLAVAACAKKDEVPADTAAMAPAPAPAPSVSAIELGRRLDTNNRITDTTSSFGVRDTIYAAVVMENAVSTNSLTAKWTFASTGQVVDSTTQAVAPATMGATTSVTEFHISKPTAWPTGTYRVEIFLDGVSTGVKEFEVKR